MQLDEHVKLDRQAKLDQAWINAKDIRFLADALANINPEMLGGEKFKVRFYDYGGACYGNILFENSDNIRQSFYDSPHVNFRVYSSPGYRHEIFSCDFSGKNKERLDQEKTDVEILKQVREWACKVSGLSVTKLDFYVSNFSYKEQPAYIIRRDEQRKNLKISKLSSARFEQAMKKLTSLPEDTNGRKFIGSMSEQGDRMNGSLFFGTQEKRYDSRTFGGNKASKSVSIIIDHEEYSIYPRDEIGSRRDGYRTIHAVRSKNPDDIMRALGAWVQRVTEIKIVPANNPSEDDLELKNSLEALGTRIETAKNRKFTI